MKTIEEMTQRREEIKTQLGQLVAAWQQAQQLPVAIERLNGQLTAYNEMIGESAEPAKSPTES